MYAVVGCNDCNNLWLLRDPGTSAQCPRCGKRHQTKKLRRFFESEDREAARQARAAMLAEKQGELESFRELDSVAEMEQYVDSVGVDEREYLERSGFDANEVEAVEAAGDVSTQSSRSRREIVVDALREQDRPAEDEIVAYATDHGVPADAVRDLLKKLTRRGEVSESRGRYRLL